MTEPATNPPDPELTYPDGSPEDTTGPDYVAAERDAQGRWIDPDSGEPATYPVPDHPAGGMWTVHDLRRLRDYHASLPPPAPVAPPAPTEEDLATPPELGDPGNVGEDGGVHFMRTVGDIEVCGHDGQPWPCRTWREEVAPGASAAPMADGSATTAQAAELLGVDPATLAAFLATRQK